MQMNPILKNQGSSDPFGQIFSKFIQKDSIFQKYKQNQVIGFTAFKLVQESENQDVSSIDIPKSSELDQMKKRKKRGSYRKYTLQQKQQAIQKIFLGEDVTQISNKYGIPRRNLLRWKKNGCQRKQGGGRPTDGQLQNILYQKILNNDLRNEKQIRQQAKKLSKSSNFKASKGWYCKFHRRFLNRNSKQRSFLPQKQQYQNKQNCQKQVA